MGRNDKKINKAMKKLSISEQLLELFELYKSGTLSRQEYDLLKSQLLNTSAIQISIDSESENPILNTDESKDKPTASIEERIQLLEPLVDNSCESNQIINKPLPNSQAVVEAKKIYNTKKKRITISIILFVILIVALIVLVRMFLTVETSKSNISNNDNTEINNRIGEWDKANNSQDVSIFSSLYYDSVLFYGKKLGKQACIENKILFFKQHTDFFEEIIGKIQIENIANNSVKCSFIKRVRLNQETKDYPSYLIFIKNMNEWKISIESDLLTDRNLSKSTAENNSASKQTIIQNWLKQVLNLNIVVNERKIMSTNFNVQNYEHLVKLSTNIEDEYFDTKGKKPEISYFDGLIIINFLAVSEEDDNGSLTYYIGEKYFVRSYHLLMGTNGRSTIYFFDKNTNQDNPFIIDKIENNIAIISRDWIDNGHYWQTGKLNLENGQINWGNVEH